MLNQDYSWQLKKEFPKSYFIKFPKEYLKVYKRADFKCEVCRKNNCRLNIHHKDNKGYGKVGKPNNNLDNLLLVCSKCHMALHGYTKEGRKQIIMELVEQGWTLDEIGETFKITRQRVHQIKTTL